MAEGDQTAFKILVGRHIGTMRKVLFAVLNGNRPEIEEVEQEVLIALCRALPGFRFRSSFSTWFYRFCRNKAVDYLRRKGAEKRRQLRLIQRVEAEPQSETQYDPELQMLEKEKRRRVWRLLSRLSVRDRELLVLKEIDDLGLEEISGLLGIPVGTVKSRLHRVRKKAAALVEKEI